MNAVLVIQALVSLNLMGLIWVIQVVHYPMFARLDRERFSDSIRWHGNAITWVVAPLMVTELLCAAWLCSIPKGIPNFAAGASGWFAACGFPPACFRCLSTISSAVALTS